MPSIFDWNTGVPQNYNEVKDPLVALDPNKPVEGFQLAYPGNPEGGYINPQTKEFITSNQFQERQGINRYGIKENQFNPITNAEGNLQDKYKLNLQGLDPAQWQGYQKLKGEALRTGPSAWAQLQGQKQGAEELAAKEAASRQAAGANTQARQQLSMGGGLNSGARGRLAAQSQRDLLAQRQQVGREGMMARLGISQSDETNRLAGLKDLAGSEQNISQFNVGTQNQTQQVNLQNLLAEMQNKRQFEADKYKQNMASDQANRSAEATARQGVGGGK